MKFAFSGVQSGWLDLRHFAVADWYFSKITQQFKDMEAKLQAENYQHPRLKAMRRGFMPKLGLETMVSEFLNKKLQKSPNYHIFGDWESYSLSESQLAYAAADAAAGLDVFLCFIKLEGLRHNRVRSIQQSMFKYEVPGMEPFSCYNLIDWTTFVEKPLDPKDMRLVLLKRILQNLEYFDQYSNLESDYFWESNHSTSFTAESYTVISKTIRENWMAKYVFFLFLFFSFVQIFALIVTFCGKKSLG